MEGKYFSHKELACPCCDLNLATPGLITALDAIREAVGRPIILNSVTRCESHNINVGGSVSSSHLGGFAADIRAISSGDREAVLRAIFMDTLINRVGEYREFFHIDNDPKKVPNVFFWGGK